MGDLLQSFGQWLLDLLLWLPRKIWDLLLDGLLAVVTAILPPDAVNSIGTYASQLTGGVVWFLDLVQFQFGFGVVCSALLARWVFSLIPIIGK